MACFAFLVNCRTVKRERVGPRDLGIAVSNFSYRVGKSEQVSFCKPM